MSLHKFKCKNCDKELILWDYEDKICECGNKELLKTIAKPIPHRSRETVDTWLGTSQIPNVTEDLKKRSKEAIYKDLNEMIEEFGKKNAIDMGWINPKTGKKISYEEFMSKKDKIRK